PASVTGHLHGAPGRATTRTAMDAGPEQVPGSPAPALPSAAPLVEEAERSPLHSLGAAPRPLCTDDPPRDPPPFPLARRIEVEPVPARPDPDPVPDGGPARGGATSPAGQPPFPLAGRIEVEPVPAPPDPDPVPDWGPARGGATSHAGQPPVTTAGLIPEP